MTDQAKGEPSIEDAVELIEQDRFEEALSLAEGLREHPAPSLYEAGRLAALECFCRYMLDEDIDSDSLSRQVAEETRADYLAGLGIELSELDALDLAEPALERLTVVAPDDVRAWYNYGYLLSKQEEWRPAVEALERATALDGSFAVADYRLGCCYLEINEPQRAAAAFDRFLSLEPDDVDALILGGMAHSNAGQYDKAIALLERAISVDPESESAYFNLAVVAHRSGDRERLWELKTGISRVAPDGWRASAIAASLNELQGSLPDAWACLNDAFSRALDAEDWDSLDTIVESALSFALKHGYADRADTWIERIFGYSCLAPGPLHYLRALTEPLLARASSFRVMVEGRRPPDDDAAGDEGLGYFRTLRVFAETAEEAEALAMAFDRRLGWRPTSAETLDREEGMTDVHRGVHWCTRGVHLFPLDPEPEE